jgi:hypothetical protein
VSNSLSLQGKITIWPSRLHKDNEELVQSVKVKKQTKESLNMKIQNAQSLAV